MTSFSGVFPLTGFVLSDETALRRQHVRPPERRSEHYLERFDDTTLFYDCVYLPEQGRYVFTAPRFLNLWEPFSKGLKLDGKPVALRRRKWLRCEQVELRAPKGHLTLTLEGSEHELASREGIAQHFTGANALLAVNKNNELHWIEDWARYHARAHGADALVLFDNGSTIYSPQEIAERVVAIEGMKAVAIYSAPFPYGPTDRSGRLDVSPRFFQSAMLNIARRDALARANGVLSIDIDEIVRRHGSATAFELARRNPLGMISIHGSWVYPPAEEQGATDQGAHVYRQVPDRKCNRKWCLAPDGIMSRFGWAVHQIGGIVQNVATNTRAVSLLHCKGTSTGWKKKRFDMPEKIAKDPDLVTFMRENFPLRDGVSAE
jgi:hypothetical protein